MAVWSSSITVENVTGGSEEGAGGEAAVVADMFSVVVVCERVVGCGEAAGGVGVDSGGKSWCITDDLFVRSFSSLRETEASIPFIEHGECLR